MANLTDFMITDFGNMFMIIKVGIAFSVFYFILSYFFKDLFITDKKNKKLRSFNKSKINNNEKIKPNIKVSLRK